MDWKIVFEMAALSLASYDDNSEAIGEWYDHVVFFRDERTSTECYFVAGNGIKVVAVRGTDSPRDWFWNFCIRASKCKMGRHYGFNESATAIMKSKEYEDFLALPGGPIFFTGHSKGGSVAQILALYAPRAEAVFGFGPARAGSRKFRCSYLSKTIPTYLFRNKFDIVSWLPPKLFGYTHVVDVRSMGGKGHDMGIYLEIAAKKAGYG